MVPLYREALERWEARDDSILQATEVAEIRASRRDTAADDAKLGCSVAEAAPCGRRRRGDRRRDQRARPRERGRP
jgi:hypothetical protein